MPKYKSKYDAYFEINHETKKSKCKTCGIFLLKNCTGMSKHLRTKHEIVVGDDVEENTGIQSPSKKARIIEPIEDQVCREAAKNGASFR